MENSNPKMGGIPVNWDFGSTSSKYATNLLVQSGENEMFLAFFEIRPPLAFNKDELATVDAVTAECVGRIIVSADKMQSFIDAMQKNLDAYKGRETNEEQDDGSSDME